MDKRSIPDKKGFTLVEVLLSSTLILLVFAVFINALYYSINLRVNSQNRLQALLKAQTCLEELRGFRGENAGQWSDIDGLISWLKDEMGYEEREDGSYTRENAVLTLSGANPGIPDKLIPVQVEVSYEDRMDRNRVRTVRLRTRLREF